VPISIEAASNSSIHFLNAASHCDIAWAGALATEAHNSNKGSVGAEVG